jgi:phosphate transport system ATP-binding protein
MESTVLTIKDFNASFGTHHVLKNISLQLANKHVLAMMGPSGCGKTTLVRCINRLHELVPGATTSGTMMLGNQSIYDIETIALRKKVGMVFQRPNPFPKSIFENVAFGLRINGITNKAYIEDRVKNSLIQASLWDEVKDKLKKSAFDLSGGQQQRLCLARAIAVEPTLLLMDEPTSALDPLSTMKIEELIYELKNEYTIVIVTHNMQQAGRVSDKTAFFYLGELIEFGDTKEVFTNPKDPKTQNYITGRFG